VWKEKYQPRNPKYLCRCYQAGLWGTCGRILNELQSLQSNRSEQRAIATCAPCRKVPTGFGMVGYAAPELDL
jgi:hypothetical protein